MIFRSDKDKADLMRSWHRPDRSFFASGACHILAHIFLQQYPDSGYHAINIRPHPNFRGGHIIVSDGNTVFDYHGYSDHDRFMAHYFAKIRRYFPGWQADLIPIHESLVDSSFCAQLLLRTPPQYLHDPMPRARAFLARFKEANISLLKIPASGTMGRRSEKRRS